MTALARSLAFSLVIAIATGCGERKVVDYRPVPGDHVVVEITPALPWKAKQFALFCVRFKVFGGNERGYLKEVDVPADIAPRVEMTLLHDKGKSSIRQLSMIPDC